MSAKSAKPKVLMIDDETDFIEAMTKALQKRNFDVVGKDNVENALRRLENEATDVVVLDVKMPGVSGYSVFQIIKRKHPDVQVIFLTGHGEIKKAFEMTKNGAFGYLTKPCPVEDLAHMITRAVECAEKDRQKDAPQTGRESSSSLRVLVIDDEEDFLDVVSRVLSRRQMTVMTAPGGVEGLQIIRDRPVDVVVLDIKMPGMHGLDVLQQIKKINPFIEVILLTGHASVSTAVEGMKCGAFDYLNKPQNIDDLVSAIIRAGKKKRESVESERQKTVSDIISKNPT